VAPIDRAPYPGLRSFRREETDLFFGRDECVEAMVARLAATRFLAVLGSSGTGKSSLVKTGLLSGLEMGLLDGAGSRWRIVDFRPGGMPLRNLARRLIETEHPDADGEAVSDMEIDLLLARLKRGPRALIEWCRDGHHLAPGTNLLLLVDQFEELFRYQDYAGREEAEAFVALLLESRKPTEAAEPQDAEFPIYVTITMRSEYLGACALIEGLAEAINEGTYLTPRMTREECREAIVGPARVCEVEIEPALVNRLLNDLANFAPWDNSGAEIQLDRQARRADQLPLLQYTLNRMWEEAKDKARPITLTVADYIAIGGLSGALDKHANALLEGLARDLGPARGRAVTGAVFRALTLGNSVADAVRRPTRFGDLVAICGDDQAGVTTVTDAFRAAGCNFLTPEVDPRRPVLNDNDNIDISHESLIRQWGTLSQWLENEARIAHEWRRLEEDAARGELLSGQRLALAVATHEGIAADGAVEASEIGPNAAWARRYGIDFERVNTFIAESVRAKDARVAAEKARRWRGYGFAAVAVVVVAGFILASVYSYRQRVIQQHYYNTIVHLADTFLEPTARLVKTMAFNTDAMDKMRMAKKGPLPGTAEESEDTPAETLDDVRDQWRPYYEVARSFIGTLDQIRMNDPDGYVRDVRLPRAHLAAVALTAALRPDVNSDEAKADYRKAIDIARPLVGFDLDVASTDKVSDAIWVLSVMLERENEHEFAAAMHGLTLELLRHSLASNRLPAKDAVKHGRWVALELLRWGKYQLRTGDTAGAIATLTSGMDGAARAPGERGRRAHSRMAEGLADALLQRAKEAKTAEARTADREEATRQLGVAVERIDPHFRAEFARWLAAAEKDEAFVAGIDAELANFTAGEQAERWDRRLNKRWLENQQSVVRVLSKLGDLYLNMGTLKEAGAVYAVEFGLALDLVAHDETAAHEKHYDNDKAIQDFTQALRDLGYWEKELKHSQQAAYLFGHCIDFLKDRAERDERVSLIQSKLGFCFRDRGIVYTALKARERAHDDYAAALRYFDRAAGDPELARMPHMQVDILGKLAGIESDLKQPEQAAMREEEAIAMAERNHQKQPSDETLADLSAAYAVGAWYQLMARHPEAAKINGLKAYGVRHETWSTSAWSENLMGAVNLAHAHLFNGEFDEAKEIYLFIAGRPCEKGICARSIKEDFTELRELQYEHPGMCVIGKLIGDEAYAERQCEPLGPEAANGRGRAAR
jgi:hypothetical protein